MTAELICNQCNDHMEIETHEVSYEWECPSCGSTNESHPEHDGLGDYLYDQRRDERTEI